MQINFKYFNKINNIKLKEIMRKIKKKTIIIYFKLYK